MKKIDTEYRYTEAYNKVLNKYGKNFSWELKASIMGFHFNEAARRVVEHLELPITPEELMDQVTPYYDILFPDSQLMPGMNLPLKI